MTTPAQRAADTRRIRTRAAVWRKLTRPNVYDDGGKLKEQLDEATQPVHYIFPRPPMSYGLLTEGAEQTLAQLQAELRVRSKWHPGRTPERIGRIRQQRYVVQHLRSLRDHHPAVRPQPVRPEGIAAGDLMDTGWGLEEVASVTKSITVVTGKDIYGRPRGEEAFTFVTTGGREVVVGERWEVPALRVKMPAKAGA